MDAARILAAVTLIALVTASVLVIVDPAVAMGWFPGGGSGGGGGGGGGGAKGAPGPIAGAGLITVVIGAGAYWLFRRFRNTR
jgi:hypothetical protein